MIIWDYDGANIEITIELWRIKEWFYKLINRVWLRLGKGYYFIDCGYCRRERGKMKCGAGPSSDEICIKEKCGIFNENGEDEEDE